MLQNQEKIGVVLGKRKDAKNQNSVARIAWCGIADYDADLPKIKAYAIEQETKDRLRHLSGNVKQGNSTLKEIHYEKKQQRLF